MAWDINGPEVKQHDRKENLCKKDVFLADCRHGTLNDSNHIGLLFSDQKYRSVMGWAGINSLRCTMDAISLQAYALIRRYTEWKSERKEEIPVMVGKLEIFPLQRTVEWEHKRIPVVKREFDFLYLLASTPGRVYTYSQIYQLVWQEYQHGDITNIIYCMVHRLKRKLKNVDVNAEHIIISVKEVGYCLKI